MNSVFWGEDAATPLTGDKRLSIDVVNRPDELSNIFDFSISGLWDREKGEVRTSNILEDHLRVDMELSMRFLHVHLTTCMWFWFVELIAVITIGENLCMFGILL